MEYYLKTSSKQSFMDEHGIVPDGKWSDLKETLPVWDWTFFRMENAVSQLCAILGKESTSLQKNRLVLESNWLLWIFKLRRWSVILELTYYVGDVYGRCMEYAWNMYGMSHEYEWSISWGCMDYGICMGYALEHECMIHSICMELVWNTIFQRSVKAYVHSFQ